MREFMQERIFLYSITMASELVNCIDFALALVTPLRMSHSLESK